MSVYNGDKFTAERSFEHFIGYGHSSHGVVAVSVHECSNEKLPCIEDNLPYDGHAYINYEGFGNSQIEKLPKKLKVKAALRGWLYRKSTL